MGAGSLIWVDPIAAKQMRTLALREDRTVQNFMTKRILCSKALDELFAKHGMHRLARSGE